MKTITSICKKLIVVMLAAVMLSACWFTTTAKADTPTGASTPTENQYLELRAVDVVDVGDTKQVIMQLWAHNLQFKGFQVRFSYDHEKLQPSNMDTNEVTLNSDYFFRFESEFQGVLDFFTMPIQNDTIEGILSLDPDPSIQ